MQPSWHRLADSFSWSPGHSGKGYFLHNGTIKTWNVDPYEPIDHHTRWQRDGEASPIALRFDIDPDGGVVTDAPSPKVDTIVAADPRLYDAGQRPVFEDAFDLAQFAPEPEAKARPDWNFINSHIAAVGTRGHINLWTGLRCHCGWGGHGTLRRTGGLQLRKLLKAPDKAFRTPVGQAFLEHLGEIPEDYDSLLPYLARRFKKGDVRLNTEVPDERPQWQIDRNGPLPAPPAPRLEWQRPAPRANWMPLQEHLPRWHQWYEARQHPTRRGVNIMDPEFSPWAMEHRAIEHQRALEAARRKEQWLAEYGPYSPYGYFPTHTFGPEAGKYNGWHVIQLTGHQAEGDSEALGHCIGHDDQPYKHNIESGNIDAYSLRDREGYPHVSWHINPSGHDIGHMQGASGSPNPEYRRLVSMFNEARGLPDEEGYEDALDPPYDAQYTFPQARDVEDYIRWHGEDWREAAEDDNVGPDTEFEWEDPDWGRIAHDYLDYDSGQNDEFMAALRRNGTEDTMAAALERAMDPSDEDHRTAIHYRWNPSAKAHNEIDLPPPPANEVDQYLHAVDDGFQPVPNDWDHLAQDYLQHPNHYGYGDSATYIPPGHSLTSDGTQYEQFHDALSENSHEDEMRAALERNLDGGNPDHQQAVEYWNRGFPTLNLHAPAPEPPQQLPGQMSWDWPEAWLDGWNNPEGGDWDWDRSQYVVPNANQPYIPRTGHWHLADYQGYTNSDTWQVGLLMDNDEPLNRASRKLVEKGRSLEDFKRWAIRKIIGPHNREQIKDAKEWNDIPLEERQRRKRENDIAQFGEEAVNIGEGLMKPFEDWQNEGKDEDEIRREQEYEAPDLIDPELVNWDELYQGLKDELDENEAYDRQINDLTAQGLGWPTNHDLPTNQIRDAMYRFHGLKPEDDDAHRHRVTVPWEHFQQMETDPGNWLSLDSRGAVADTLRAEAVQKELAHLRSDPTYADDSPEYLQEMAEGLADHNRRKWRDQPYGWDDPRFQHIFDADPRIQEIRQQGYQQPLSEHTWKLMHDVWNGRENPYVEQMQQALTQRGYTVEQIAQLMAQKWRWDEDLDQRLPVDPTPPVDQWADRSQDQPTDFYMPEDWGKTSAAEWTPGMNWQPGTWGKGLMIPAWGEGSTPALHTWSTDGPEGAPHHRDAVQALYPNGGYFTSNHITISPDGLYTADEGLHDDDVRRYGVADRALRFVDPDRFQRRVFGSAIPQLPSLAVSPAQELREWLADLSGSEPEAPSIHHRTEDDLVQAPAASTADDLPYYPPSEIPSEMKQSGMTRNQYLRQMAELERKMGPDKSRLHHQFDNGWSVVAPKSQRDIKRAGTLMGHCWQSGFAGGGDPYVLRDPDGIPRVAYNVTALHMGTAMPLRLDQYPQGQQVFVNNGTHAPGGHNNSAPKPEHWDMLREWANAQQPPVRMWHHTGQRGQYGRMIDELGEAGPNPNWDPVARDWVSDGRQTTSAMTPSQKQRQMAELAPDESEEVYRYPDDWTIRRLPTWPEVGREGEMMHHCWADPEARAADDGGEWPTEPPGIHGAQYMSLRDPSGWPHASFHYHPEAPWMGDLYGHGDSPLIPEHAQRLLDWWDQAHPGQRQQAELVPSEFYSEWDDGEDEMSMLRRMHEGGAASTTSGRRDRTAMTRSLYHGTLIDHLPSIQQHGLVPQNGPFVSDAYELNDGNIMGEGEPIAEVTPATYMTDKRDLHRAENAIKAQIAMKLDKGYHQVSPEDVATHGLLVKLKGDQEGYGPDDTGLEYADGDDYYGTRPYGVEPGDWYSESQVSPQGLQFITGPKILQVLRNENQIPHPQGWSPEQGQLFTTQPYWDPQVTNDRQQTTSAMEPGGSRTYQPHTAATHVGDSPINQADATNDPLGKNPAIVPSRQGDPDYLKPEYCPGCHHPHRPDEPCPDSSVAQYRQQERAWYNRDPNALHGAPEGLTDHQTDLGSVTGSVDAWEDMCDTTPVPEPKLSARRETADVLAFLTSKYGAAPTTPQHTLWFKPSPRGEDWGRGIIHEPTGTIHTWPEGEAEHDQMMAYHGYQDEDAIRFILTPTGAIQRIYGPDWGKGQVSPGEYRQMICEADPAIARANGMGSPMAPVTSAIEPTLMYHVAPQSARPHIEADNGLWQGEAPDDALDEEGVYVFDHPDHAHRFAQQHPELHPYDVWEVGVSPEDRQRMTNDPLEHGGWLHQEPFLEAQSLRREVENGRSVASSTRPITIDSWINTVQGDGPYCVVDVNENPYTGQDYVVRVDRDGQDASRSEGVEGVDWEYMYIPAAEAVSESG